MHIVKVSKKTRLVSGQDDQFLAIHVTHDAYEYKKRGAALTPCRWG
jgi:hypothetical protein